MSPQSPAAGRWVWIALMVGIGVESAVGIASLLLVPVGRPGEWLPMPGRGVYLAHALLGGILTMGALVVFVAASRGERWVRLGAQIGLVGLLLGAGGVLAVFHPWRIAGIGLMLAGTFIAFFGFLIPLLDQAPKQALP
jgi:hypothetical protein